MPPSRRRYDPRVTEASVVVVGGGAAGLAAAGALTGRAIEAVVLERGGALGASWRGRYDRLRLHTVRALSGLPRGALPGGLPRYVPKDAYAAYLGRYAERLDLRVRLDWRVQRIAPDPGGGGGDPSGAGGAGGVSHGVRPAWRIEGPRGVWRAPVVVVATGQHAAPARPALPGSAAFEGELLHAGAYRSGRPFAGKRVLVVGAGNTGTELAVDLAEHGAAAVALSVRTPPFVVPREVLGVPVQVAGLLLERLPARLADAVSRLLARLALGDLGRHGLGAPGWSPYGA